MSRQNYMLCVRSCMRVCVCVCVPHLQQQQHGVCVVRAGGDVQQAVHQQDANEVTHLLPGWMDPVVPLLLARPSRGDLMRLTPVLRKGTQDCVIKRL